MKKNSKKIAGVSALVSLLFAGTAMAISYSTPVAILSIEVGETTSTCTGTGGCVGNGTQTTVTFKTPPAGANPARPTCGDGSPASVILYSPEGQADHVKALASVATAAFLAWKPVKIFYDADCTGGVAHAKAIVMQ